MTPHAPAAAETLMRHLGLAQRTTAEIQDLYSRPPAPLGAQTASTGLDRA
jgi:hypothetical protein